MPTSAAGLWRQSLDPRRGPPEPLPSGQTRIPALIEGGLVLEICPRTGSVVSSYPLPGDNDAEIGEQPNEAQA